MTGTSPRSTTRARAARGALVLSAALAATLVPAASAEAKPDTACQKAGIKTLQSAGLLKEVARHGLPIEDAVALGVAPRPGTDVAALPDPLPLSVVLADHRAGEDSLFLYPWCS